MGHLVAKDLYRNLGKKIDGLTVKAPWNDTLYEILQELYTQDEAELMVKMPYSLTRFDKISKTTGYNESKLRNLLNGLSEKGLVMDLEHNGKKYYMPSPMVIGIFEFTMMRSGDNLDRKKIAKLFDQYFKTLSREILSSAGDYNILRVIPYEDQVAEEHFVEVMDYEKASEIVDQNTKFAIGICSCRHEKLHLGEKKCDVPLEVCTSFGIGADFLIRNNLGKECTKTEMKELVSRGKEWGLVYSADNVQQGIQNMCLCCGCCCNYLAGIAKYGIADSVITSNFIASVDLDACIGCGLCAKACPINAIKMVETGTNGANKKIMKSVIDKSFCLGCGVCASKCKKDALKLVKREKRIITPEKTFHKIILQSLQHGNLQNLIFDNPQSMTQSFFRGLLGGFLRLDPVKKSLMSDVLRSRFLKGMEVAMKAQGIGWVSDM